jgi:hypothetical protein
MKEDELTEKDKLIIMIKKLLLDLPAFRFKDRREQSIDKKLSILSSNKRDKGEEDWSKVNSFEQVRVTWEILGKRGQSIIKYCFLLTLAIPFIIFIGWIISPEWLKLMQAMSILWLLFVFMIFLLLNYRFIQVGNIHMLRRQLNDDISLYMNFVETITKGLSGDLDLVDLPSRIAKGIIKRRIHRLELSSKTMNAFQTFTAYVLVAGMSAFLGPLLVNLLVNLINVFLRSVGLLAKYSSLEPEKFFLFLVVFLTLVVRDWIIGLNGSAIEKLQTSLDLLEIRDEANQRRENQ